MALKRQVELPSGPSADYWRVSYLEMQLDEGSVNIRVALYIDEGARKSGKEPVTRKVFSVSRSEFGAKDTYAIVRAYEVLKALPEFKDSEDV